MACARPLSPRALSSDHTPPPFAPQILQNAFTKKKIDRYIEVDRLTKRSFQVRAPLHAAAPTDAPLPMPHSRATLWRLPAAPSTVSPPPPPPPPPRPQSNMEFLQFIKCYWDMHAPAGAGVPSAPPALKDSDGTNRVPSQPVQKKAPPPSAAAPASRAQSARGPTAQKLELEVTELKCNIDNLECERDFYYSKLREIEVLCQEHEAEEVPFLQQVMSILLKTDADDEFVAPAQ